MNELTNRLRVIKVKVIMLYVPTKAVSDFFSENCELEVFDEVTQL